MRRSVKLAERLGDESLQVRFNEHVAAHEHCWGAEPLRERLTFGLSSAGDHDSCPLLCWALGSSCADSACAADHNSHLSIN
jgi:hypothetical protein